MKKLLALTLACLLCLPLAAPALAEEAPGYTLTLVVNGAVSHIPIAANDWTTYADADDLRALLGTGAVAQGYEGPVPVRQAAENVGWDVVWFDGGGTPDQQVCLWNRETFLAEAAPALRSLDAAHAALATAARRHLVRDIPKLEKGITDVTLTGQDGQSRKIRLKSESVIDKGVVDTVFTFDASPLAELLGWEGEALRSALAKGKAELVLDYNSGAMAWNVPLLALLDGKLAGWQVRYIPSLAGMLEQGWTPDYAGAFYGDMVAGSAAVGGLEARRAADNTLSALRALTGPDKLTVAGSSLTYALASAADVNAPFFGGEDHKLQKCEALLTLSPQGVADLVLRLREDGMELSVAANRDLKQSSGEVSLRLDGVGALQMTSNTQLEDTTRTPRQIVDIERALVVKEEW